MRLAVVLAAAAALPGAAGPPPAGPSLPSIFSDGMVIQRDRRVPVWGRASPGVGVTVSVAGRTATAKAGKDGRWRIDLEPIPAGGPFEMAIEAGERLVLRDVLVGEVWLASGQSNMAMTVSAARDGPAEIAAAKFPRIRLFTVARATAAEPAEDAPGSWQPCSPGTAGPFSAVAYYFGREVHRDLGVPLGLVHASWGGTCAEGWIPAAAVEGEKGLEGLAKRWKEAVARFDPEGAAEDYRKARERWEKEAAEARRRGRKPPPEPKPPPDPRLNPQCPGALWNGMVAPLVPFAHRGMIWYQGESNAGRAAQYRTLFPLLIREWRRAWGEPEKPFGFVQLASYGSGTRGRAAPSGGPSEWAELREAQAGTLRGVPGTGMAVAIDLGEVADIHPKEKQEVGRRLALWALARVYGRDIEHSGPLFREAREEKGTLRLLFDHAGGLRTLDGKRPAGFAVAGSDGKVVTGVARIDGDAVVVSHPSGGRVRLARYAWADFPEEDLNLVNAAGLPAAPFRTDDLPCVTEGRE